MDLLEKNQDLSPFKLCLLILLYESLTNPKFSSSDKSKTLSFIVKHLHSSASSDLSFPNLLSSLEKLTPGPDSPTQVFQEKVSSMSDFSDVLHLFIVKLNELKSDGDLNAGSLEQGGILYLFLRKCFVTFARMGFEDLVCLSSKFQSYKSGKSLPINSRVRASQLASSLEEQVLQSDYNGLSSQVSALNLPGKYLIQGHLDALYGKNSSIDNIHRYFDLVLDQQMPTRTTREKGLVVVQSSTHFASLHRVKIELQLGHLEAAVHLLVETIKRALSENDNLVILESTLLFMKIASMMGNFKQELRISQKAVLHGLKVENTQALIKTCLFYAQLHLTYPVRDSSSILSEIQPKVENKPKNTLPIAKKLEFAKGQETWVSLCDFVLMQSLLTHEHKGLNKQIAFVNTLHWVNQGFDWNLEVHFEDLLNHFEVNIEEVNFFLDLARQVFKHDRERALKFLKVVDERCQEKSCVDWEFTLAFLAHQQALKSGEFLQASFLEKVAERHKKFENQGKIMKLSRITQQKHLKEAFELAGELIENFSSKGLAALLIETRLLLSQVYFLSQEYYRGLAELNKCEDLVKDFLQFDIPVKIMTAETSLLAFDFPGIAVNVLNQVESQVFNRKSQITLGWFWKAKAKATLALAEKTEDYEILKFVKEFLEFALELFRNDRNLWEVREVLYLLARTADKGGDFENRNFYAEEFLKVNREINVAGKVLRGEEDLFKLLMAKG
jgi:hypothetical protein